MFVVQRVRTVIGDSIEQARRELRNGMDERMEQ